MSADSRRWFTSSYSGGANTECVEAAIHAQGVDIRDSKDPEGPVLAFSAAAWAAFIREVQGGGPYPVG